MQKQGKGPGLPQEPAHPVPGHPHKPGLTGVRVKELARVVLDKRSKDPRRELLRKDWRALVHQEFHLSGTQEENLRKIPTPEVERIQAAIHQAMDKGGEIDLELPSESASGSGSLTIRGPSGEPSPMLRFEIPIIKCSFDAYCSNWRCNTAVP